MADEAPLPHGACMAPLAAMSAVQFGTVASGLMKPRYPMVCAWPHSQL